MFFLVLDLVKLLLIEALSLVSYVIAFAPTLDVLHIVVKKKSKLSACLTKYCKKEGDFLFKVFQDKRRFTSKKLQRLMSEANC